MNTRPDKHDPTTVQDATWAVHGGSRIDSGSGAIRNPLVMANSYALPDDSSVMNWSATEGLVYTRNGAANQVALEEKLAAMDRGEAAVAFATGVAALHRIFFTLLRSGDHVVVSDVTYEAVWRLFTELLPERYGIEATFVDVADLDAVHAAIRPNTRLVHVETIANPTTKVADIRGLAVIAHGAGALLTVDGTFTPPPFYRPLEDGADLVVHSLTKYINGHGDAMGGVVVGDEATVTRIRHDAVVDAGGVISPFNAWMIMRGSVTLPLRLRQQFTSAARIAEFLAADPATQNRFVNNLGIITSAVSLGHDESLIVHTGPESRGGSEAYPPPFLTYGHLRLSVGLEDPDDLVADIAAALDQALA